MLHGLQADLGGTIDPCVFTDSQSKLWLLFKNDGNRIGQPTNIYLCPLTSNAMQVYSVLCATLLLLWLAALLAHHSCCS